MLNESKTNQQDKSENFGIEVTEVDFSEFDRRKAPRISSYQSLLDTLELTNIAIEFII